MNCTLKQEVLYLEVKVFLCFSEMSNIYGCKEMGKLRSVSMRACYIGSGGHPDDGNPQICRIAANIRLTIQRHKPLYSTA